MSFRVLALAATAFGTVWHAWSWLPAKTHTEDELVKVIERQLARCGPENLVCPVCEPREVCSLGNQATGFALGFCVGILVVLVFGLAFAVWRLLLSRNCHFGSDTPEVTPQVRTPAAVTPQVRTLALTLPSGILSASEVLDL